MSTNKPTPKKKSQSPSKKVAQKGISGAPAKKAAATTPKVKQKPGPKKGSTRKAQPEKKAVAKKAVAKKVAPKAKKAIAPTKFNAELASSKKLTAGAAEELNAMAKKYKEQIEKGSLRFLEQATTSVHNVTPEVNIRISPSTAGFVPPSNTKPYGTPAKKKGIISRIASWFRPSKKNSKGKKR